jgi:short subunit dehydrogenase-like uncharacterized protein
MSREFDYLVFGASGFTGYEVTLALARAIASDSPLSPSSTTSWAMGGRSATKLATICDRIASIGPAPAVLLADADDSFSLASAFRKARVVINCVGPFYALGPRVVAACIDAGSHYVDISGEPAFLLGTMEREHERAREAGVLVVCCAGFDSVPAEIGCLHAANVLHAALEDSAGYDPDNQTTHIESFMKFDVGSPPATAKTVGHVTTLECALHGFNTAAGTRKLRARLPPPPARARLIVRPPALKKGLFREKRCSHAGVAPFTTLFPGADSTVRKQSERLAALGLTQMQPSSLVHSYQAYVVVGYSYKSAFVFLVYSMILCVMSMSRIGQIIVLRFPHVFTRSIFSREGPTADDRSKTKVAIDFFASRYDSKTGDLRARAVTRVSVRDPGYSATALIVLSAAQTLLEDKDNLPNGGGVFTPGAAFARTRLESRLVACNAMRIDTLHVSTI